jgi:hypothetical protein
MASQSFTLTVLPNGRAANHRLRLSILLSPQLSAGATLADFPDMLHWPALLRQHGLSFRLACGNRRQTVAAGTASLRPDLWEAIFRPSTYVQPVAHPDYDKRLIVSYPVRTTHDFVQYAYQAVGVGSASGARGLYDLLQPLSFRDGRVSNLDDALNAARLAIWQQQNPPPAPPVIQLTLPMPATAATVRDGMTRAALFHRMPPAPHRPNLPSTPADFAKTLDFHAALTALSSYPSLQRVLGLVFDLEVPPSLCPTSPASGAYLTVSVAGLIPGFKWSLTPRVVTPATAYGLSTTSFAAAPTATPGNVAPGEVSGGLLALSPTDFNLVQVELDGTLLKLLSLADAAAFQSGSEVIGDAMPALRSGGITLTADGRAMQLLQSIRDNLAFSAAAASGSALPRALTASDLVRGQRIDIWSSETGEWHSLHRRNATYRFGDPPHLAVAVQDEEGFVQLAVAQPAPDPTRPPDQYSTTNNLPQPGTDLYVHERVARWTGWSLSAQRPSKPLNRSADPNAALDPDPTENAPVTPFKMVASFTAVKGSLPLLRFGAGYRLRVRTVDLAGNSATLDVATPASMVLPGGGAPAIYFRFEPVPAPIVVPRIQPSDGGSLLRMVIRSRNSDRSLDAVPTSDIDERHHAPPRSSVRLAETHGVLDGPNGRLRGDAAAYAALVAADAFPVPALQPAASIDVSYLPDPLARGVALRNLPGTETGQAGRIVDFFLQYETLPDAQPSPDCVTYIGFGEGWPHRQSFRLRVLEAAGSPGWDAANRVLSVGVPKSAFITVPVSCFMLPADLSVMGVWDWLRQAFVTMELEAASAATAATDMPAATDIASLITRLVLEGGHEMLTPAHTLTLEHAVQQPLGEPTFEQLPVVHRPAAPILASALRNRFTPITAWRAVGAHQAVLLGGLHIHAASTAKIDLHARWLDYSDDTSQPLPSKRLASDLVETIELIDLTGGAIPADGAASRFVAIYIPAVDMLWFATPFDELSGVDTPTSVTAPLHRFSDTKHRWITYQAVATTRFGEYFPEPGLELTRTGPALLVDVPNSARPLLPDIAYVVPTFGWEQQETSNVKTSVRLGNSLRIYLNRPWFSSGEDELLGVVLWPAPPATPPTAEQMETMKPYFTQWGNDPIWAGGSLSATPAVGDLPLAITIGTGLTLAETTQTVDVAGHEVAFDEERGLWFCDIGFGSPFAYTPFVRLALARYQPHSIQGVELSKVALADFAQIAPHRTALLSIDPTDPRRARLVVGGLGPTAPRASQIGVSVQRFMPAIGNELGWTQTAASYARVVPDTPAPAEPDAVLWSGTITFTNAPKPGEARVVIVENEMWPADAVASVAVPPTGRLVYACYLPYDIHSDPVT